MSVMRIRLEAGGCEVLADVTDPADADGLLRLVPREPVSVQAGQGLTLRLNTGDVR